MKRSMILDLACALLLGAGCGRTKSSAPSGAPLPQDQRITPKAAAQPTAKPQIPEAARNVPLPAAK